MTPITIRIIDITDRPTGNPYRPLDIIIFCELHKDNYSLQDTWANCMAWLDKHFVGVHFEARWTGNTCTLMPTTAPAFKIDPECPLFFIEA